ncbi:Uncharacterized protein YR821_2328 [Yersinia ruckeri]|uniref:Uncharacterized protein n=1 Tax=Yersinia ruckeri TaxID=29486 RepID=A0A0A8VED5_YERRU|nr:hypothetical protein yruck0001_10290 [Yersinia ruckeri ATCC 29473]QTD77246.1 Uncharacterized protein YR821_2328 [Yersinia ruckeri]CEK28132.1 hypothetical protein CSF007_11950 [Yersinia ruckeri]
MGQWRHEVESRSDGFSPKGAFLCRRLIGRNGGTVIEW